MSNEERKTDKEPIPIDEKWFTDLAHAIADTKLTELGTFVAWLVGKGRTADQIIAEVEKQFADIWPEIKARAQPRLIPPHHGT